MFDICDADFVIFEIVGESSGANAFIARHAEVFVSDRAVAEANFGASRVHPDPAKSSAAERDSALAFPRLWMSILAADGEMNGGRALPFPFAEELAQVGRAISAARLD